MKIQIEQTDLMTLQLVLQANLSNVRDEMMLLTISGEQPKKLNFLSEVLLPDTTEALKLVKSYLAPELPTYPAMDDNNLVSILEHTDKQNTAS